MPLAGLLKKFNFNQPVFPHIIICIFFPFSYKLFFEYVCVTGDGLWTVTHRLVSNYLRPSYTGGY